MKLAKLISSLKLKTISRVRAARCSKTDFGIVKVAFMVAALDGEVTDSEFKAIDALLKKCRGYTPKAAAGVLDEAMRSAGYLMLLSRRASEAKLIQAFMNEAQSALPQGFAYLSIEEVRQAIVTWIALGLSDGDYSIREKKCIEALRKQFAELKVTRALIDDSRWLSLAPAVLPPGCNPLACSAPVKLISKDFVTRVEDLIARYGDKAEAARELKTLIDAE